MFHPDSIPSCSQLARPQGEARRDRHVLLPWPKVVHHSLTQQRGTLLNLSSCRKRPGTLWTHFRTISDRSQHFCSWRANCCFLSCYIIAVISKVLYMVLSRKRSSRHCSLESWSPINYSRMCGQLSMFRILSVHFPDSGITGNNANDGNNTRLWSLQTSAYNSHQFSSLFNSF